MTEILRLNFNINNAIIIINHMGSTYYNFDQFFNTPIFFYFQINCIEKKDSQRNLIFSV